MNLNLPEVEPGRGGLPRIVVTNDNASAEIYLHGAHVTQFQPRGVTSPVLFLSSQSPFDPAKAIRGGIPICFPWFGPHPTNPNLPQHGFARTSAWKLESFTTRDDGATTVRLSLGASDATRKLWAQDFAATCTVVIADSLTVSLEVRNPSHDRAIQFSEALHSYFQVGDVRKVTLRGLENAPYLDKTQQHKRFEASHAPIHFTAETDRVYLDTQATCVIDDPALARKIIVQKMGSNSTVVWNPFDEKAKSMQDLAAADWTRFLCVEAANVRDSAITLAPRASHQMSIQIRIEQ